MAWSLDTFVRLFNFQQDRDNLIKIRADRMDSEFDNYKGGLEALLLRSGANKPTADIDWASFKIANLGKGILETDAANLGQVNSAAASDNLLRNGGFTVAQRGTSFAGITNQAMLLDGWRFWTDGTGVANSGQDTSAAVILAVSPGSLLEKSMWITGTTIGTSTAMGVEQRLENPKAYTQQPLSLMLFTNNSGTPTVLGGAWGVNFGTGGSPSAEVNGPIVFDTYTPGGAGNRITALFTIGDIITAKTYGTNNDAFLYIRLYTKNTVFTGAGDLFTRWYAGAVLSPSDGTYKPNRFVPRQSAVEFALAQRYFQKSFAAALAPAQNSGQSGEFMWTLSAGGAVLTYSPRLTFPTRMRAVPTVNFYNPAAVNGFTRNLGRATDATTTAAEGNSIGESGFNVTATGLGAWTAGDILGVHWSASAEL